MPLLLLGALGVTTIGTGFLVFNSAAQQTNDTAQKFIVTGVAAIGLYASWKLITKS